MKHPHPSGRPIRRQIKKPRLSTWQCPLEQPATPRLRPRWQPAPADAIGFREIASADDDWTAPFGFVDFGSKKS